ncbi:thermonuclease family protein [Parapedobacter sp. GCM10030251]|uniref:thermonuclease family protein n=1 Tax=Parapedobacter sp. GCM10030251 TaxID=3273419 RepID=UPI00361C230F
MFSRVLVLFLFLTSTCTTTRYLSGEVVRVADGDTFTMLVDGQPQRIRLHGIDCPEKGQPYSRVATQFTKDLLASGKVKVQEMDTDRYGRVIGIVLINDTINLNERLLEAGLAWHYKNYDHNPQWARLENVAQTAKHGLWVEKDAIAPWEWRKRKRTERSE